MLNVNVSIIINCEIIKNYIVLAFDCVHGQIELYGGPSNRHGNIRICNNGRWGKVCGYGNTTIDNKMASVVCAELGFSPFGILYSALMYVLMVVYRCIWFTRSVER